MRNYFDYRLKGSRIFPAFLLMLAGMIVLQVWNIDNINDIGNPDNALERLLWMPVFLTLYYFCFILANYFIIKLSVENTYFKGVAFRTDYSFGRVIWEVIKGLFFSLITFGIYSPWFMTRLMRYFVGRSSFDGDSLRFNGSGLTLFGIITLAFILPVMVIVGVVFLIAVIMAVGVAGVVWFPVMLVLFLVVFLALMNYFVFKWIINISYRNRTYLLTGSSLSGALYLLWQTILSVITLGLYFPAAYLRIYRYLANSTKGYEGAEITARVGCDVTMGEDYLYVLGQMVLAFITLGIYGPWSIVNVSRRMINKTWIETPEEPLRTSSEIPEVVARALAEE